MLNSNAPLSRGRYLILLGHGCDAGGEIWHSCGLPGGIACRRIVEIHLRRVRLISEGNVVLAHVVLFVSADPFVEDAASGAQNSFLAAYQNERKPDARSKSVPVIVDEA